MDLAIVHHQAYVTYKHAIPVDEEIMKTLTKKNKEVIFDPCVTYNDGWKLKGFIALSSDFSKHLPIVEPITVSFVKKGKTRKVFEHFVPEQQNVDVYDPYSIELMMFEENWETLTGRFPLFQDYQVQLRIEGACQVPSNISMLHISRILYSYDMSTLHLFRRLNCKSLVISCKDLEEMRHFDVWDMLLKELTHFKLTNVVSFAVPKFASLVDLELEGWSSCETGSTVKFSVSTLRCRSLAYGVILNWYEKGTRTFYFDELRQKDKDILLEEKLEDLVIHVKGKIVIGKETESLLNLC
jgi:hypothetical protein